MTSQTVPQWAAGQAQSGSGDQVIYYRKPDTGLHGGWITWGDSISGSKQRDMIKLGFYPLIKYGTINNLQREVRAFGTKSSPIAPEYAVLEPQDHRARYLWEQILTHPDGPAEFPVEQVVAYRWYRPEKCPVPEAYFPQLEGVKIRELTCPEHCGREPFVELNGVGGISALRQHLRIMHKWDQSNLNAYGERVGIDFNRVDVKDILINEVTLGDQTPPLVCEECEQEFRGGFKEARFARHKKTHMKSAALVETVG